MMNRQRRRNSLSYHHTAVVAALCSCFVFVFVFVFVFSCSGNYSSRLIQLIIVLQYYINTVGTPKYPIDVLTVLLVLVEVTTALLH